ncbi:MAG: serine/threonine-protein kinase [Nannocystaceae bacterium]|nr:protein kinase [bacterium]
MGLANIAELERKVASQLTLANIGLSPLPMLNRRYRIEEIRGRGARGLVVRAMDTSIGRIVALKIYPPTSDERLDRELVREAQALGRLEHPNVVRIYDVGHAPLTLEREEITVRFMSIEYVEGASLRAWAQEKKRRRSHLIRALLAAAEGLAAAHRAGLVHRDVKPDNIMVETSGAIKVVDFGLARGLYAAAPESFAPGVDAGPWATSMAGAVGTPEYMAPEAREGRAFAEADQYSFAMSAWELLVGVTPYDSSCEVYKPPEQPGFSGANELPRHVRSALERALEFHPSRRHRDMRALVDAIRRGQSLRRVGIGLGTAGISALGLGVAWTVTQGGVPSLGDPTVAASVAPSTPPNSSSVSEPVDRAPMRSPTAERANAATSPPPEPTSIDPRPQAQPLADPCGAVSGSWHFTTAVSWANNMQFRDINGLYELDLEHDSKCRFDVTVRKMGSSRRLNAPGEISAASGRVDARVVDGRVLLWTKLRLRSRAHPPREYMFAFQLDGPDSMSGTYWHRPAGTVAHDIAGFLEGARHRIPSVSVSEVEVQCAFECIPGCADEASTQSCVDRCGKGGPAMPCGAPTNVASAPARSRHVIDRLGSVIGTRMRSSSRRRCAKAARWLEGDWTLHVAGGPAKDFHIGASDCQLTFSGDISGTGDVDGHGAWTKLVLDGTDELGGARLRPDFALTGWGPAFGLTHDGDPAAAFRRR